MVSFRQAEQASMKALQDRREKTRKDFFKGRQDVSPSRLDRRQIQSDLYEKFKQEQMKPVPGTGGTLFQSRTPGGPTLADRAQELAFKYGPTPRELLGDIGYGIGSIGRGLGDFIGRGGVIGSVLSDLFGRVKSGAQQGIETVGGLYDNLRNVFKGESQFVTPQAQGGIFEGQPIRTGIETLTPQFPYNFETIMKPRPDPLLPSEMSQEQFMQSFPELYSSLFQQRNYEPIRVSDMDITGVTAQEGNRPVLPENVIPRTPSVYPLPTNVVPMTPVLPQEVTDPRMYQGQSLYADASQQDIDRINKMRQLRGMDPQSIYDMRDIFQLSPELTLEDIQGIKEGTITQPTGIFAKDGGSVDKYAGLGYKLK